MEGKQKNQTNGPVRDDLNDRASRSGGMLALPRLILASGSPRRAEILRVVGWPFETLAVNIDESRLAGEDAAAYVQRQIGRASCRERVWRGGGAGGGGK